MANVFTLYRGKGGEEEVVELSREEGEGERALADSTSGEGRGRSAFLRLGGKGLTSPEPERKIPYPPTHFYLVVREERKRVCAARNGGLGRVNEKDIDHLLGG